MKETRIFRRYAVLALVIACFVFAVPARASLSFSNGNFSTSVTLGNGVSFCAPGYTCTSNVTDWSSQCNDDGCGTGSTVLWVLAPNSNGSAFNNGIGLWSMAAPPDDENVVADDGDSTYSAPFWQTISGLVVGDEYAVTFYQAAAQQSGDSGATTEQWEVSLGSQTEDSTLMNNASEGFVPWEEQTLDFTATSTSEVLKFLSLGSPNGLPPIALLSDVSMTQVPEPAEVCVMVAAFVILVAVYRRRKHAVSRADAK